MVSPQKLLANRLNARLSTGPRTPDGKARSSRNSVKFGIFSALPVITGMGETPEAWAAHRDAVVAALAPVGAAELNLAERAAHLMWRLARAAKFDAAAAAVAFAPAALLDRPDHVFGQGNRYPGDEHKTWRDEAEHLSQVNGAEAAAKRRAADVLAVPSGVGDDEPVDRAAARAVMTAAREAVGWRDPGQDARLVHQFAAGRGVAVPPTDDRPAYAGWTAAIAREAAAFVANDAGKDPALTAAAAARALAAEADRAAGLADRARREALDVDGMMAAKRVADAMARVERGQRELDLACRYERHLTRELFTKLQLLAALQARRAREAEGDDETVLWDAGGD